MKNRMTVEEAISYLESISKYIDYNNEAYYAVSWEILEAIQQAIEALKAQQWIPCSERLPDGRLNKSYLVQDKDGRRAVGTYTKWGWMFGYYMNDPVAWMPLPEPYKEDDR